MDVDGIAERERALIGGPVRGRVEAVFRWGVIVNLGMSHLGLIDALYIDDGDEYQVGDEVEAFLECFDEKKREFILRPPNQQSVADRLRRQGFNVD